MIATMRNLSSIILTILIIISANAGEFRNVGHSGANFLQIPPDAAAAAMGNSSIAMSQGTAGLYWNPASISIGEGTEIQLSGVDWILDTRLFHAGAVKNFGLNKGAVGIWMTALTMDKMEITTESQPDGTGEYFNAGNIALGAVYAKAFTDRFNFGCSVKWVYEYIWEASSSAAAFDFGSVYRTDFRNLRLAMNISNFGGAMQMSGSPIDDKLAHEASLDEDNNPREERLADDYSLPQLFNVGIAVDPFSDADSRLTITAMANNPNDNQTRVSFGGEYAFKEKFFLRAGLKTGYDEQTFSGGVGFNFNTATNSASVDYAFSEFGILGYIHHLTFKVRL